MAFLSDVKKKIDSTKNTRKITRAMQLVAANKMKIFQRRAESSRHYAWRLLDGLHLLRVSVGDLAWSKAPASQNTLFVIVTSDKGLCGGLNTKLLKTLFQSHEWLSTSEENRLVVSIGRKSTEAVRRAACKVVGSFEGLPEDLGSLAAFQVLARIVELWEKKEVSRVILVSPHYVNPFTIHYTVKNMLPLSDEMIMSHAQWRNLSNDHIEEAEQHVIAESSVEEVSVVVSLQLTEALFWQAFYELKASEYSSRMVAMKKATEAADDMIGGLTTHYNKLRQASITQQLAELVGGSEALSDV